MDELEALGDESNENEGKDDVICKPIIVKFEHEDKSLTEFVEKFEEPLSKNEIETFESDMGAALIEAANSGCKFRHTYKFESTCKGKFLYLVRN